MGIGSILLKYSLTIGNFSLTLFALILGGLGVVIFQHALKNWKSSLVTSISMGSNTLISVLGGIFLLKESLLTHQVLGACLILIGILVSKFNHIDKTSR